MKSKINEFMDLVKQRNHQEPEFLQAVLEVAETVIPYIVTKDIYYGK
ncbi:MAG TPA: glutamate dehydrogenase, partial [Flavobacteriaceae bacterium]|nr:glutamate dehydrogenase [Flavobacteriaceae bacterium]